MINQNFKRSNSHIFQGFKFDLALKFTKKSFDSFLKYFLIGLILVNTSCSGLTKALWNKSYQENIRNFLISRDGSQAVFLGDKYHYVLSINSQIINELLLWKSRKSIGIDLNRSYLKLEKNNNITGYVTIRSSFRRMPNFDFNFLQNIGFKKDEEGLLSLRIQLFGKRYRVRQAGNLPSFSLNRNYAFKIHTDLNMFEKVESAALTPITVAIDTAAWITDIIFFPYRKH